MRDDQEHDRAASELIYSCHLTHPSTLSHVTNGFVNACSRRAVILQARMPATTTASAVLCRWV